MTPQFGFCVSLCLSARAMTARALLPARAVVLAADAAVRALGAPVLVLPAGRRKQQQRLVKGESDSRCAA